VVEHDRRLLVLALTTSLMAYGHRCPRFDHVQGCYRRMAQAAGRPRRLLPSRAPPPVVSDAAAEPQPVKRQAKPRHPSRALARPLTRAPLGGTVEFGPPTAFLSSSTTRLITTSVCGPRIARYRLCVITLEFAFRVPQVVQMRTAETAATVAAGLPAGSVGALHLAMGFEHPLYAPLQLRKLLHAFWGKLQPGAPPFLQPSAKPGRVSYV